MRCERRDLGALLKRLESVAYPAYIKVLCATRLTDGLTVANFARLFELLPGLEVLDLTKSTGLTMPIMRFLISKLQLLCVIDAAIDLARVARHDAELWPQWLTHVVWLGVYDFDKYEAQQAPEWRQCSIHHRHWFETVLLMHLKYAS
jgi:hypothetical protein